MTILTSMPIIPPPILVLVVNNDQGSNLTVHSNITMPPCNSTTYVRRGCCHHSRQFDILWAPSSLCKIHTPLTTVWYAIPPQWQSMTCLLFGDKVDNFIGISVNVSMLSNDRGIEFVVMEYHTRPLLTDSVMIYNDGIFIFTCKDILTYVQDNRNEEGMSQ